LLCVEGTVHGQKIMEEDKPEAKATAGDANIENRGDDNVGDDIHESDEIQVEVEEDDDEDECRVCRGPAEEGYAQRRAKVESAVICFIFAFPHLLSSIVQETAFFAVQMLWVNWANSPRLSLFMVRSNKRRR